MTTPKLTLKTTIRTRGQNLEELPWEAELTVSFEEDLSDMVVYAYGKTKKEAATEADRMYAGWKKLHGWS